MESRACIGELGKVMRVGNTDEGDDVAGELSDMADIAGDI